MLSEKAVIPAKAGTQGIWNSTPLDALGSRLRGNDGRHAYRRGAPTAAAPRVP